jgi:ribosomal protein L12E/L44/L45/RPP1/RPP2
MTAFPFSPSVFYITGKVDQGFASLLQASQKPASSAPSPYHVSMTEKVRIKSLIEETRVTAVNAASASGQAASIHDLSDADTEDDEDEGDEDDDDVDRSDSMAVSLGVSKIYRRTLEILGDSLVSDALPPHQEADVPMS